MRRFLLGSVIAAFLAVPAMAADMRMPVKAPPAAVVPVYNWTGFYIGANAGYGWGDSSFTFSGENGAGVLFVDPGFIQIGGRSRSLHPSGFVGGGQFGYNWQLNRNWVAGIEVDIDYAHVRGSVTFPTGSAELFGHADSRLQWFGTLRARLGYLATDRLLVFATGGLGFGQTKARSDFTILLPGGGVATANGADSTSIDCQAGVGGCMAGSRSRTTAGWVVGGGLEYAVSHSVSLKAEYLHLNLGDHRVQMVTVPPGSGNGRIAAHFDDAFHIVRAGINFKFAPGPVVARY